MKNKLLKYKIRQEFIKLYNTNELIRNIEVISYNKLVEGIINRDFKIENNRIEINNKGISWRIGNINSSNEIEPNPSSFEVFNSLACKVLKKEIMNHNERKNTKI